VEAIEGHLRVLKVLAHPGQVRPRHVLADLLDALRPAAVRAQKPRELLDSLLAAAVGHEHRPAL